MSHCSVACAGAYRASEGIYAQGGCPHITVVMAAVVTQRHSSMDLSQSGRVLVPLVSGDNWYSAGHQGDGWQLWGLWTLILDAQGLSITGTCHGWVTLPAWQELNHVAWGKLYPAWVRSSSARQLQRVTARSKKLLCCPLSRTSQRYWFYLCVVWLRETRFVWVCDRFPFFEKGWRECTTSSRFAQP